MKETRFGIDGMRQQNKIEANPNKTKRKSPNSDSLKF